MEQIAADAVHRQLLAVLKEGFEGPAQAWSYFTDNKPDSGLLGSLSGVSAADASQAVAGTSVAAHVYHVNFAVGASADWIRGERTPADWSKSWTLGTVDDRAWKQLQDDLRRGYDNLLRTAESHSLNDEEAAGGAVAAIAHTAYHLGAIRQKLAGLRNG